MNHVDTTAHEANEAPKAKQYSVEINGKVYTRTSDNSPLLEKMEGTGYLYMPINTLYLLLEGLYETFDVAIIEPQMLDEKYETVKTYFKNNQRQERAESNKVFRRQVIITVAYYDDKGELTGKQIGAYVDGVANSAILSNDGSRYAFFQKLEARGIKAALRKLAPIFRINDPDEDDITTEKVEDTVVKSEGNKETPPAPEVQPARPRAKRGTTPASTRQKAVDAAVAETSEKLPEGEAAKDVLENEFSQWGLSMADKGFTQQQLRAFSAQLIAKYGIASDDGTKNMDYVREFYESMLSSADVGSTAPVAQPTPTAPTAPAEEVNDGTPAV